MKKYLYSFLIVVFSLLFFVGCDEGNTSAQVDNQEMLLTPSTPTIEKIDDRIIVSTSKVLNASNYQFTINNVNFTVNSNVFDCTNYIIASGEYSIKVTAIGDGIKYLNSYTSSSASYVLTEQLSSPTISISNNKLYITRIENASNYEIYLNDVFVKKTTDISVDLSFFDFKVGENVFKVKAVGNSIYKNSNFSNQTLHFVSSKLEKVFDLNITNQNSKYILSYNEVQNATNYVIVVNNENYINTDKTIVDISSMLSQIGNYQIKVKAISTNVYYVDGEFAETEYSVTEKLDAPTLSYQLNTSYVQFEWQNVLNAKTYSMYINNQLYPRLVWTQNDDKLISLISKDYLNRYSKPLNICIKANGYNFYLDSDNSNTISINNYGALQTPHNLQINNTNGEIRLSYDYIENAVDYTILINDGEYIKLSKTYYVDLSDIVLDATNYSIKVKANKTDYFEESAYSSEFNYSNYEIIDTPRNPNIEIRNNTAVLSWDEVEDASYYIVKFITYNGDEVVKQREIKNLTSLSYIVNLTEAGKYGFNVVAINEESDVASMPSVTVTAIYTLSLDQISDLNVEIDEENKRVTATWGKISNAVGYNVYLTVNGVSSTIFTTETYFIVTYETDDYEMYSISVVAVADENGYWQNSRPSSIKSVSHGLSSSGNTYYYYGEERSKIIYTQEDFNAYISYMQQQKETDFTLDIYFDVSKPLSDAYFLDFKDYILKQTDVEYIQDDETIMNEFLTALYSYNRNIGGVKTFENPQKITDNSYSFHIEYYSNGIPTEECTAQLRQNIKDYMPLTFEELELRKRDNFFNNFNIDKLQKFAPVYNTDQLYEVIMYCNRKPQFMVENSMAEQIYNIAKNILCDIISDEMTELQKVCAIYDYLVYNTQIDNSSFNIEQTSISYSSYLEGVFIHKIANSFGISKAFCLLCAIEGINSRYVLGYRTINNTETLYAINKVKIGNSWYVIDIVYACTSIFDGTNYIPSHYFNFLVSDNDIKSLFKQLSLNIENSALALDYFANTKISNTYDLYIQSIEEFEAVMNLYISLSKTGIECKISKDCDNNELFSLLSIMLGRDRIERSSNSQLYLIKLKY